MTVPVTERYAGNVFYRRHVCRCGPWPEEACMAAVGGFLRRHG